MLCILFFITTGCLVSFEDQLIESVVSVSHDSVNSISSNKERELVCNFLLIYLLVYSARFLVATGFFDRRVTLQDRLWP